MTAPARIKPELPCRTVHGAAAGEQTGMCILGSCGTAMAAGSRCSVSLCGITNTCRARFPHTEIREDARSDWDPVFKSVFRDTFIPAMKALGEEIGLENLISILGPASSKAAAEAVGRHAATLETRDLEGFVQPLRDPDGFYQDVLRYHILEDSPTAFEIEVTECLWARSFREMNASEIGYASVCNPDFAAASAFNPNIKLIRTRTLMQGQNCCNHRWILKPQA